MSEAPVQLEAFPAPLRAVSVVAWYEPLQGWHLEVMTRREGGTYHPTSSYDRLLRNELVDVMLVELVERLEV